MAGNFKGCSMPNQLAPTSEKKEKKFGVEVARAIIGATSDYMEKRNFIIARNKKFSNGKQPVKPYLDQMSIDGNSPLVTIRFKARPIASKFKRVIVNGYLQRKEKIRLESLSKDVRDRKDKRRNDAMFRKDFGPELAQLQEQTGVEVEPRDAFVPESEEHNDIWFSLNDREREELILQKSVDFCLRDNNIDSIKKKVLTECFEANLFGLYTYTDRRGRFVVDFIRSEDCIYGPTDEDAITDAADYAGRRLRMSISKVRSRFKMGPEDEEKLFEMAKANRGKFGNSYVEGDFEYRWQDSATRPYDSQIVEIAHVWWKCSDEIEDGLRMEMAYEGYWIVGSDTMLEWGACKNILREGEDKESVLCPFIFHMIDNDGEMLTRSLLDNMIDSIEVMDLTVLKIKQLVAKVRPNGYVIDLNGLDDVDLGNGVLDPLAIADIRNQTGDTYYRSRDADGNTVGPPIKDDLASMGSQVQELINVYNTELNNIRDYLGINEYREGGKVPAKLGLGVLQAQLDSSNTATYSVYWAWATALKTLAKHICIRIGDELAYNPNPNKGLLGILGKDNEELFKERKDITASQYDIAVELEMESEQRQQREQNISTALASQEIQLQDAEYIRNIGDYSLSMRYLAFFTEKRKKEKREEADSLQKANSEYQTQTAIAGEKEKQNTVSLELSMKKELEKEKGEQERVKGMEQMVWKLIELSQTNGTPINPIYMPLVEKVLGNLSISVDMEQVAKDKEVAAIEQEEQDLLDEEQAQMAAGGEESEGL